jgi:type II secretion system protein G
VILYCVTCYAGCGLLLLSVAPRGRASRTVRWAARSALAGYAFLVFVSSNVIICDFSGARSRTAKLQVANLDSALSEFRRIHGSYPDTSTGLSALVSAGLIRKVPRDPWGNPYEYSMYGSHYVLRTFGADHRFGGSGDDADIDRFVVVDDGPGEAAAGQERA